MEGADRFYPTRPTRNTGETPVPPGGPPHAKQSTMRRLPWNRILTLTAFAVAMGYMEAVIVVYIRHLGGMVPMPPGALDYRQFLTQLPPFVIPTEQTREAATIIMLVALALAVGRSTREKVCVFLLAFGVWDIFYYVGLKALLNWPPRLTTTDVLFLIPQPWFAPVWLPLAVSAGMIAVALWFYPRGRTARR